MIWPSEDLSPGFMEHSAGSEGHILFQLYLHKKDIFHLIMAETTNVNAGAL